MSSVAEKAPKDQFKIWHHVYAKEYELNSEKALHHYKNFKSNMKYIKEVNASQNKYKLGLGPFADLSYEEFRAQMLSGIDKKEKRRFLENRSFDQLADEDDAKVDPEKIKQRAYEPELRNWAFLWPTVRHQKTCGSCWAYASLGVIEAHAVLWQRSYVMLSTQQLVDCDTGNNGCGGGWYSFAFDYLTKNGVVADKDYPYENKKGSCRFDKSKVVKASELSTFKWCDDDDWRAEKKCSAETLATACKWGPWAAAVDANKGWQHYESGIFEGSCISKINHAIIVSDCKDSHYGIRNSWGEDWGEGGYMRLLKNARNEKSCNVEKYCFYPYYFKN